MSRLLRGMCLLKKPPANEITEPLAFIVCKVELRGKAIVLQSRFSHTHFRPVVNNNRQNRRKATCNKTKKKLGSNMTGRKNRKLQVPPVIPYKALGNIPMALYGTTRGTCSSQFFHPVLNC